VEAVTAAILDFLVIEIGATVGFANVVAGAVTFGLKVAVLGSGAYLAGRVFQGRRPSFTSEAQDRTHVVRSAVQPYRVIYGETMTSGALVFATSVTGESSSQSQNSYALKVWADEEAGSNTITLYTNVLWNPHNTIDLTIEQNTEITFAGDGTTYTVQADATGTLLYHDDDHICKVDLTISPALQQYTNSETEVYEGSVPLAFVETVPARQGTTHKYVHMVISLAGHQVQEIGDIYFDDTIPHDIPITSSSVANPTTITTTRRHSLKTGDKIKIQNHSGGSPDINGEHTVLAAPTPTTFQIDVNVTQAGTGGECFVTRFYEDGDYNSPLFRIKKHLGSRNQDADPDLVSEVSDWTNDHRLRGRAYIYVRFTFDEKYKAWPNGIPNIKAIVKGRRVHDPRTMQEGDITSSVPYDSVSTKITAIGHGLETDDLVRITGHSDDDINDEHIVTVLDDDNFTVPIVMSSSAGSGGTFSEIAYSNNSALCVRDYLTAEFGLNCGRNRIDDAICIASANVCDEDVELDASSDPETQKRYTCDGSFTLDMIPKDILESLCSSMASPPPVWTEGKYRIFAGAYQALSLTLDEDDLRDDIEIHPRTSRQKLFNAVRGVFTDPNREWQPTDFPPIVNSYYESQDGGQRIYKDIELPFTQNIIRAQRIAKIYLEKERQPITVRFPAKITGYQVALLDTIGLKINVLGWNGSAFPNGKEFTCVGWSISKDGGIDLDFREEASGIYDWNYGEATTFDYAPDTALPRPHEIDAPNNLTLTEEVYKEGGRYKSRVRITWDPVDDYSIMHYILEGAYYGSDTYYSLNMGTRTWYVVENVPRGRYSVRLKAVNLYQCSSDWISADITVFGINPILASAGLAPPIQPKLFYTPDKYGHVNKVRFQCQYRVGAGGVPTGILLLYAISDYPNMLTLGTDSGSTIDIAGGAVIDQGEYEGEILAGSTRSRLILRTETNPFSTEFDRAGMFWFQFGSSQWRKASGYDELGVDFRIPFDVDPTPGQKLNYIMIGWIDDRDPDNRLLFVRNAGGDYEVIKWGAVEQAGNTFRLTGCSRGQEGTTQMDVSGLDAHYYPWIGPGTAFINFPLDSFSEVGKGIYEANADAGFNWLPQFWSSFACLAYIETEGGYIRSYIVPAQRGGGL